ncbi:MAG: class I SAM-dependent RNA methyltransferase [Desulfobacterales bacterium]|nr:class I SAM-dependent RNA methyltransferase [Desulfobacterales bacterium]
MANKSKTKPRSILQKGRGKERRENALVYDYEKDLTYFAQVSESVKSLAEEELKELGAKNVAPEYRGIRFKASRENLYRIVYQTRMISRVLAPIKMFACPDNSAIYKNSKSIKWIDFISRKKTFAIVSNVSDSNVTHSQYAALRVKDAIADYFRDMTGKRPDVDKDNPDLIINLHIRKDMATLSVDLGGGALHKRGYREKSVMAPMQEIVAAAIIKYSGFDGTSALYDPMCGSGTLLCEALMVASNIPSGIFRQKFGFKILPDFDEPLWEKVKAEADSKIRKTEKGVIAGSDILEDAVNAAKTNLFGIHYGNSVEVLEKKFEDIESLNNTIIVINPPYGIRLLKDESLENFYKILGDFLKQKCKDSNAYIYFGDVQYIKSLGLKPEWKKILKLGQLDGRLVKYELF